MKRIILLLLIVLLLFASLNFNHIANASNIVSINEIQTIGIGESDFIGSVSLAEVNFFEKDYDTRYLFPMQGMCVTPSQNIAVVDNSYGRVHLLTPLLQEKFSFGKFGDFDYPTDISYYNGNFYIADPFKGEVRIYDENGNYKGSINNQDIQSPVGIAINSSGIYISDYFQSKIVKLDFKYNILKSVSINYPLGLTTSAKNLIYAVSGKDNKIYVYDSNLNLVNAFGDNFLIFPSDVTVDSNDNIYVVDRGLSPINSNNPKILIFDKNYKLVNTIGSFSNSVTSIGDGQFLTPSGIAVGGNSLYVFDSGYFFYLQSNADAPFGYPAITRLSVFNTQGDFIRKKDFIRDSKSLILLNPLDASLDESGNTWILNKGSLDSSEIVIVSQSGDIKKVISKLNNANLSSLNSIYADKMGHVITCSANQILVFNTDGTLNKNVFNTNLGLLRHVTYYNGYYWFTSLDNNAVIKTDKNFSIVKTYSVCKNPSGIAFNSKGQAFITSIDDNKVHVYDSNFKEILSFGSQGKGAFNLYVPESLAIDNEDNVYVANTENGRITVFTSTGAPLFETKSIYHGITSIEVENSHILSVDAFHNVVRIFEVKKQFLDYSFVLSTSVDKAYISQNDFVNLYFSISNTGLKQDSYSFSILLSNNKKFSYVVSETATSLTLLPKTTKTLKVTVKASSLSSENDSTDIIFTVTSLNSKVSKSINSTVLVSKNLKESLQLDDANAMLGSYALVPLYLKNPSGIASISCDISFDNSVVSFTDFILSDEFKNSVILKNASSNTISLLIGFEKGNYPNSTVKIGDLKFKTLKIGTSQLSISNAKYLLLTDEIRDFENTFSSFVLVTPYLQVNLPSEYNATNQTLTISGKTTPGCSVFINDLPISVDSSGNFSFKYTVSDHNTDLLIIARAKTGEETSKSIKAIYLGKISLKIVLQIGNPVMYVNDIPYEIDPGRGTTPTIIQGWNRTVVPIRAIVEKLGGNVSWSDSDKVATILLQGKIIKLQIGNNIAVVDGKNVPIDKDNPLVKPLIINDRTMVPLRFVAEQLGCNVLWDGAIKKITIEYVKP